MLVDEFLVSFEIKLLFLTLEGLKNDTSFFLFINVGKCMLADFNTTFSGLWDQKRQLFLTFASSGMIHFRRTKNLFNLFASAMYLIELRSHVRVNYLSGWFSIFGAKKIFSLTFSIKIDRFSIFEFRIWNGGRFVASL